MVDPRNLKPLAAKAEPSTRKLFAKLKKTKPKNLDEVMSDLHHEAFANIDCLECANCCKTTSPIFYQKDIERLAHHFKIRPSEFIEKYLHIDEDKDYVLNAAPCPFLGADNYCSVYDARPTACREYPHTDRKRFYQILDLTLKNTAVCPAAYEIVERLKERL
ncbi:MAG: YkgJ family cysteine cluster protein [Cytophagaceae bacterium]|nr:YkgJ family cysteine cluster protein [Cytophagaceae bacterium]